MATVMLPDQKWIIDTWANDRHLELKRELTTSEKVAIKALAQMGSQKAISQLEMNS